MPRTNYNCFVTTQSGFTLLEVLVAVIVLALGLLGVASLQVTGIRTNQSAYMRSQATLLAHEMADRMRANRTGTTVGNYDNPALVANPQCRTAVGCTPQQMAQNDAFEWNQTLGNVLPNGQGIVCLDTIPVENNSTFASPSCNGGNTYAIKIWWNDDRDNELERFVITFQP